jgi:hypothetical protein
MLSQKFLILQINEKIFDDKNQKSTFTAIKIRSDFFK